MRELDSLHRSLSLKQLKKKQKLKNQQIFEQVI